MRALLLVTVVSLLPSCAVINQGEVGVLRRWGKLDEQPVAPGLVFFEPVSTQMLRVPVRLTTVTVDFTLPSKEGLNVDAQISILYRVEAEKAPQVLGSIGENYVMARSALGKQCRFPVNAKPVRSNEEPLYQRAALLWENRRKGATLGSRSLTVPVEDHDRNDRQR